ncbi:MAG: C40 family peptidase [Lacibacter sp.]
MLSPAVVLLYVLSLCNFSYKEPLHVNTTTANQLSVVSSTAKTSSHKTKKKKKKTYPAVKINTGYTTPGEILDYAKTFIGTPYRYAHANPETGFDCSGYVMYVFNHFNITVPRKSTYYTNAGVQVKEKDARPGDIILFTGTNKKIRVVGHMGIVEDNNEGKLSFLHASSGKEYAVTRSVLENSYRGRLIKIIRVFPADCFN